ncbi:eukaryotic translation initiation factor 3 subunit D-like [Zophobas morio]|uniref:eukaryotic translation initiation factor 3 subunit D-like n=1 Tax=Zophobas morio TaxID=2755281 RepID=UPI003082F0E1
MSFEPSILNDTDSWGPPSSSLQFSDILYQPFNKNDRIGKVIDWTSSSPTDRRPLQPYGQYSSGNTAFTYIHGEDESSFSFVNTAASKTMKIRRFVPHSRKQRSNRAQRQQQSLKVLQVKNQQKRRLGNAARTAQNRYIAFQQRREHKSREPSVAIPESWELLEVLEFSRFQELSYLPGDPVDLDFYGLLETYDKSYENVRTKNTKPLQRTDRYYSTSTTTEDPIIAKLARANEGNVFATDLILSTLMTCTRSVYSWDIIAERVENELFLDKREKSSLDYLEVSETAPDPPSEESELKINTPKSLATEATFVNHHFAQQILLKEKDVVKFKPNPFIEEGEKAGSVCYRYRKWDIGGGNTLVARTEIEGLMKSSTGEPLYLTIKALNEYKSSAEWRQQLDSQPGAVLSAELKKNTCKLARWAMGSLLAGTQLIKLGYVSRVQCRDNSKHVIMGLQTYKPSEFADQIHFHIPNCWGILRSLVDLLLSYSEGRYLILKDPNAQQLQIYRIPHDESEDESE